MPNRTRFVTDEMGLRGKLHGSNFDPLMSALGQKQTFHSVRAMSALPPKADIPRALVRRWFVAPKEML